MDQNGAPDKTKRQQTLTNSLFTMEEITHLITAEGTNAKAMYCCHCGSQFISPDKAERAEHEQSQSHFQKLANAGDKKAISSLFWKVPDVWDFDNIAQTRKVMEENDKNKPNVYLLCSDCDKGPVAVRWAEGEPFYISHSRVLYERPEGAPENGALPAGMSEEFVRSLIAQQQQQNQAAEE
jgi:hypothetical protein